MQRFLSGQEWGKEAERRVVLFFLEKSPSSLNRKTREIKNSEGEISRPGGESEISHLAHTTHAAPATDSLLFLWMELRDQTVMRGRKRQEGSMERTEEWIRRRPSVAAHKRTTTPWLEQAASNRMGRRTPLAGCAARREQRQWRSSPKILAAAELTSVLPT